MSPTTTPALQRQQAQEEAAATRLRIDLGEHLWRQFPQHGVTLTDQGVREGVEAWRAAGVHTPILVPSSAAGNQLRAVEEVFATFG